VTFASPAEGSGRDGMRGLGAFRRLGRARRGCHAFNVSPEGVIANSSPKAKDTGPAVTPLRGCRAIFIQQDAGMRSFPNMPAGLALMIGSREAFPMRVQPAGRLPAVSPCWMPRGGAISPRRRRAPFDTPGCLLPAGQTGGDGDGLRRRRHPFISLRSELAGDPAQDFADRLERLRSVGLRHAQQCGGVHARASEQASRVSGEVCRECDR
jgi:hypothetical protein